MNFRNRIVGSGTANPKELKANPLNWRKHPQLQQKAMKDVLDNVGWIQDVIINKTTGRLIDGHLRVETALKNGETEIPVKYVELTEDEEKTALATFDPISAMAEQDSAILKQLVEGLETDIDLSAIVEDYDKLLEKPHTEEELESVPEAPTEPVTKRGDMYRLGDHVLMCGDSTSADDVAKLMQGVKADLCLTDPPYGLGDTESVKNNYISYNDTKENLVSLIAGFLPLARKFANVVVLTPGNSNQYLYPKPDWTMAWFFSAGVGIGPWGFCCWQPLLCYGKDPQLSNNKGSHPDAYCKNEASEKFGHPCTKPIGVWIWFLERCSFEGQIVLDLFGGSGTTLIACEETGRKCRMMELAPEYCDVIVARWEKLTGKKAEKLNE